MMYFHGIMLMILSAVLIGCRGGHDHTHADDHPHDAHGNHISPDDVPLEPESFTIYSARTELFVEFKPMIKGMESRFAAHFTTLGETFTALDSGSVTLTIAADGISRQSVTVERPDVPGIFRLVLTPEQAGDIDLVFHVRTNTYTDTVILHHVQIFEHEPAALAAHSGKVVEAGSSAELTYLKEQAWKTAFANAPAVVEPFADVIRTSGRIEATPGDLVTLSAQVSGILSFIQRDLVPGAAVKPHTPLFAIQPSDVVKSNLDAAILQAQQEVETSQQQYERARSLAADKIVSDKELIEIRQRLDIAMTRLADLRVTQDFQQRQQHLMSPVAGYLLDLDVANGEYVTAGQPVATITANKRMLVRADVSQRYFSVLHRITAAHIVGPDGRVYRTQDLHGRVAAFGRMTPDGSPFVPLYFEIDREGGLLPGAAVQLYLLADPQPALVIPATAILEEQGNYFVYVQTSGESFEKRDIRIGSTDGLKTVVLAGVNPGERVVTKGAYQIKLATAAGVIPAHGHEH